jgi:hypothetical protein
VNKSKNFDILAHTDSDMRFAGPPKQERLARLGLLCFYHYKIKHLKWP